MPFEGATPVNCAGIVPAQMVWFALIEPTTSIGKTVMVTVFDVAGFPVGHVVLEVRTQTIASALTGIYA